MALATQMVRKRCATVYKKIFRIANKVRGAVCIFISALIPASKYILKANYRNTRKRSEICSKLTIKTPGRRPRLVWVSLLIALNIIHNFSSVSFDAFVKVNVCSVHVSYTR